MGEKRKWNSMRIIGLLLIMISVILFLLGVMFEEVEVYLVLFIPVIKMKGIMAPIGMFTFIIGMVILMLSSVQGMFKANDRMNVSNDDRGAKWGGMIFLGPIPIIIGDKETRSKFPSWWKLLMIGSIIMMVFYIFIILILTILM